MRVLGAVLVSIGALMLCVLVYRSSSSSARSTALDAPLPAPASAPSAAASQPVPAEVPSHPEPVPARVERAEPAEPEARLDWWGWIVDGVTNAPLAGARVGSDSPGIAAASGRDGYVRLRGAVSVATEVRVELAGYLPGSVRLEPGHEERARASVVRLLRSAALELRASDADGFALEGAVVTATAVGGDRDPAHPSWQRVLDSAGKAVLEDLPPHVSIEVQLASAGLTLALPESPLRLEPGERRALDFTLTEGCTLAARALESDGTPAAYVEIALIEDDQPARLDVRLAVPSRTTLTDQDGRFEFAELAPGVWAVGAADGVGSGARPIAPAYAKVVVAPGQTRAEASVTLWRELYIRGSVVAPDGELAQSAQVTASKADFALEAQAPHGWFELGPLIPGEYELGARVVGGAFAPAAPVEAEAGSDDVRLALRQATSVEITVVDAHGDLASRVELSLVDESAGSRVTLATSTDAHGRAVLEGVDPGTYAVCAWTDGGDFALARGVVLRPAERASVRLELARGARLRLRVLPVPLELMTAEVRAGGLPVAHVDLRHDPTAVVPAGMLQVALFAGTRWSRSDALELQTVVVGAGEVLDVVFDLEDDRR